MILTENSTVSSGNTLLLTCVTYGVPLPKVKWLRNGVELTNGSRTNIYMEELEQDGVLFMQSLLEICGLDAENDTGTYSCEATNDNGTETQSLQVYVDSEG